MIARELTEFFAAFAPDGHPVLQGPGDPVFLSNVNACYRRDCWEEIRFPDVPYAEDQAFARAMLAAGWTKVYEPGAAVLHAHDYGPVEFMRRYFDEYRGLRETLGHVEPLTPRSVAGRDAAAGGRRPPLDARALVARRPARALDRALGAPPLEPAAVRRAGLARRPPARRRAAGDLARGRGPARRPAPRTVAASARGAALGGGRPALEGGAGARSRRRCPGWRRASGCTWRW